MPWARHRIPLFTAALLDAAGLVLLALGLSFGIRYVAQSILPQSRSLFVLSLIYGSLGWLFGSYTLLKLRKPSWTQYLARLSSTAITSVILAAAYSYLFRLQITSTLFYRSTLIPLFLLLIIWSALIRILLRRYWPSSQQARWHVVALKHEIPLIESELKNCPSNQFIPSITELYENQEALHKYESESLAISAGVINDPYLQLFCQDSVRRGKPVHSLVELAEQELQRIPCRWVDNQWLLFAGHIDGQRITFQKQMKRYADVLISLIILILSSPLLVIAFALVKIQDGGPFIYRQKRSGLLGEQFNVLKIRTMTKDAEKDGAKWAQKDDARITRVGYWLRRVRIDELPQLINVLRGEMSLIGPRPEQPTLEKDLEANIPNYRLRHWVRPGLSGWAQVNMPYASSISDSELKLSYDLFYIRNATILLDILILIKTIKIVLKAAGR